jgi:hypothetical protein
MPFATRPVWLVALIVLFLCGALGTSSLPRSWPAFSRQSAERTTHVEAIAVDPIGTSRDLVPRRTAVDASSPAAGARLLEAAMSWLRLLHPVRGMDAPRFSLRI